MWPDNETGTDFLNFSGVAETVGEIVVQARGRPISIGVSGAWGAGKSSMIKLIRHGLENRQEGQAGNFVFIEFNAWLYQGYDDARAALLDRHPPKMIILDMDSSVSPTYGEQEGTAYNGHFGCTCYHPLFLFNQFGDLERCSLRPGNVHSADGWRNVLEPVVMRYKERKVRLYFRGDAAFASPEIYEYLEAEGLLYVIRLKANAILQRNIAHLLTRPVGRPPDHVRRFHASFSYQAGSWNKKRRVVAKVEWHPGELVPRVGFIVTNLSRPTKRVVAFYNHRGTAEQHIKEGKNAINWTRLSCRKFRNNAVRLQLHALAYNLGNFMRPLALPKEVEHWSMTTLRDKLVKIGAKVVRHGRYVTFQLAEVAVPRDLFRKILSLIDDLRRRPAPA